MDIPAMPYPALIPEQPARITLPKGFGLEITPASCSDRAMFSDTREDRLPEPWVTKQQFADHLGVTRRWIETQQTLDLPTYTPAA